MSAASRATSAAPVDREADIGRAQRRSVVDAVAEIANDPALRLQREDDRVLLPRDTRKKGGLEHARGKAASSIRAISWPVSTPATGRWSSAHRCWVTSSLSPLTIFTVTPLFASAASAAPAPAWADR